LITVLECSFQFMLKNIHSQFTPHSIYEMKCLTLTCEKEKDAGLSTSGI